jgi:hypothetical protein
MAILITLTHDQIVSRHTQNYLQSEQELLNVYKNDYEGNFRYGIFVIIHANKIAILRYVHLIFSFFTTDNNVFMDSATMLE